LIKFFGRERERERERERREDILDHGVDYGGYALRAKVSASKPRERESFPGRPVIKARVKKKLPRKFLTPFHVSPGTTRPGGDKIESSLKRRHVSPIDIDTFESLGNLDSFLPSFLPSFPPI